MEQAKTTKKASTAKSLQPEKRSTDSYRMVRAECTKEIWISHLGVLCKPAEDGRPADVMLFTESDWNNKVYGLQEKFKAIDLEEKKATSIKVN